MKTGRDNLSLHRILLPPEAALDAPVRATGPQTMVNP
ncbi:Uncharacterised protein [Klebsiella michiganensis]|uniref:Uncharacterized protein n=1 Tax=Klebsiella michiganensis TaxID=1134687 RepID=A0A7H4N4Z6_9ENTR|nr:Uncharacterised protein [Klebsiella michiganensis]